ncbi:hypothetical protein Glove_110g84 [Diversispora epigaea]|uniref:Uncharacterized protein n=1 Tax=Diversispora epigaea TaxID=1348612 RepID=A0A397J1U8_9GLOM|nr:hypothetical protein Glove_110g84 [Diversispora epigaea]
MPCHLKTICFVEQHNEMTTKNNFIVNAVGITRTKHQEDNRYLHITAFILLIPRDTVLASNIIPLNADEEDLPFLQIKTKKKLMIYSNTDSIKQ